MVHEQTLMANLVVVGAQWGDEGKGKIVDLLTENAQVVVRFQGGNNAGHTLVVNGQKTILHLVPAGILHPGKTCVIGNGCVVDPAVFLEEVTMLRRQGVAVEPASLAVSHLAHVICPWHKILDALRERCRGDGAIGTTGRGIGPAYEDKIERRGIRIGDLLHRHRLAHRMKERLPAAVAEIASLSQQAGQKPPTLTLDAVVDEYAGFGDRIRPHVRDCSIFLSEQIGKGTKILFEGAQGTLLDVDHGTYPYVTSSNTVAGNATVGSGIGPTAIDRVLGIAKAYTTRVGGGPFPTELFGAEGAGLREAGAEYGATTGRARRCGWLDAVILRYAARVNGLWALALTKLDVLTGRDTISVCVAYELNGVRIFELPNDIEDLSAVKPIYETLPGWKETLSAARSMKDLPAAARAYVKRVEEIVGIPVACVSVGAERSETILLMDPFQTS